MNRTLLRKLVDACYQEFLEQPGAVPSTQWADRIIDSVLQGEPGDGQAWCPSCCCLVFVRLNGNVVAHRRPDGFACAANERSLKELQKAGEKT